MTFKLMEIMQRRMATHRDEDEGATMVEYGLMVSLVAMAVVIAATALGTEISRLFNAIVTAIPG